jgi:hypothetical protein
MIELPRGRYFGKRLGERPADESEHFSPLSCLRWLDRLP